MSTIKYLILGSLLFTTGAAQARIIDFVYLTEGAGQLGESAWSTLSLSFAEFDVDISGSNGHTVYAYLDFNHAGLGVCGAVDADDIGVANPGSGSNVCNPSSDDNITEGEAVHFVFSKDVTITKIWFNNTHDPDRTIIDPDVITIDGDNVLAVGNGYAPTSNQYNTAGNFNSSVDNWLGPFSASADTAFIIAYAGEQFYISGMEVAVVPEPCTLVLLGSGVLGIGLFRRRRSAAVSHVSEESWSLSSDRVSPSPRAARRCRTGCAR